MAVPGMKGPASVLLALLTMAVNGMNGHAEWQPQMGIWNVSNMLMTVGACGMNPLVQMPLIVDVLRS
eukprot:7084608-Ditylum_brightwellii.AAC.1